jgi:hypothetical protein
VIKLGNRDVPAKLVLQSISKSDLAVGNHGGERRTSKNLGDRADAHEGVAVGRLPVALGGLSITVHDRFAVSYDRDDEPGHVCAEKYECAGEKATGLPRPPEQLRASGWPQWTMRIAQRA